MRDRPRRRHPRTAHGARRARRLRVRHVVEELEARARRPALPATGRHPTRVPGAPRAPAAAAQRAPSRRACCRSSCRSSPRTGRSRRRSPRRCARRSGCTTSPAASGSASCTAGSTPTTSLAHCPTLPADRLSSGFVYYDAATDDARLTLTIARTAAQHGAVVANRCEVRELTNGRDGRIDGAVVDTGDGDDRRPRAASSCRPPACGPTSCAGSTRVSHPDSIRPAKGVHVTMPWRLVRNDIAVIISVPGDKRSLFLVPWGELPDGTFEHCYVGTTDTDFAGDLDDPQTDDDDLDVRARRPQPRARRRRSPATTSPACGRGCGRSSRRPTRCAPPTCRAGTASAPATPGLVTVTGGKLTTYREMATTRSTS